MAEAKTKISIKTTAKQMLSLIEATDGGKTLRELRHLADLRSVALRMEVAQTTLYLFAQTKGSCCHNSRCRHRKTHLVYFTRDQWLQKNRRTDLKLRSPFSVTRRHYALSR
jgi:hypothetical protein